VTTSVLVTRRAENHYIARALLLPEVVAQGATEAEAVSQLQSALQQLQQHSRVIEVDLPLPIPATAHPWQRFAGMWQADPDWNGFLRALADARIADERGADA
jgi:predicted RNase H-like HicB family nuclease